MVFFRESGSDRQWKSLPGYRKNGDFKKGEESNPKHHYVQSAKIHPKISEVLQSSENINFQLREYIPREDTRFTDEDTYQETYYEIKNPKLKEEFELLNRTYNLYKRLWIIADTTGHFKSAFTLKQTIEYFLKINKNSNTIKKIQKLMSDSSVQNFINEFKIFEISKNIKALPIENQKKINELVKLLFEELIYPQTKKILEVSETSFEPDFSLAPSSKYKKGDITIEEYEVSTPEGDNLVYAMACDSLGRVYIDNIYDKNSAVTPYGTYKNLINAGMLVYKPEDYAEQTSHIPREYKLRTGDYADSYDDIADVYSLIPVIKKYRENLKSRGVYIRPLKSEKT